MIEFGLNRKDIATLEREAWDAASSLRGECNERLLCQIENYMMALEENAEDAENKMKALESELAQARAAAVQWVTYDGTPDSLPKDGVQVLVHSVRGYHLSNLVVEMQYDAGRDEYLAVDWWCGDQNNCATWVLSGDRWAYLPTPPEDPHG